MNFSNFPLVPWTMRSCYHEYIERSGGLLMSHSILHRLLPFGGSPRTRHCLPMPGYSSASNYLPRHSHSVGSNHVNGVMAIRHIRSLLLALVCLGDVSSVLAGQVQNSSITLPSDAAQNRGSVVNILATSYNSYLQFALPHDDLAPISESFVDSHNGWGASIVDALTMLFLIDQPDVFESAVNYTATIDFSMSNTDSTVSVFETTIRYMGSMLSAYELSGNAFPALITQAETLANKLSAAWVGSNAVPFGEVDFSSNQPSIATSNVAEAGTLTLEWSRLAEYTGNDIFRQLAENSVRLIANNPAPIPGIPAQGIDPSSGSPVGDFVTWGGGTDSYLEYLIKYARITNTDDNLFADTWSTAVDSSIRTLARTSTVGNFQYLADLNNGQISHVGSHLACFFAGNWLLGGKLTNNDTIVNFALAANDACWNTYASTATGIGPEAFGYISSDGDSGTSPSQSDLEFYDEHGFFILPGDSFYDMRPEVLESNFYAWRVTGDTKYYDRAVSAMNSFNEFLRAGVAYAP
ncbi:putative mannosyl-oligosaccharide alpha-1,2-mannosidase 1B [Grifola frondosa]|uniref:alpha-1,2-Mannosidase n=1 Tax=Grifola frondosa TaxID=5627 RepID=A0A1C7LSH2_GRIFR|nr:putative mannosyl-oligosaccharide alpha-1,2-mannosidase 1B [Grifola frondosa]